MISVGDTGLMFHARVRTFNQFVTVTIKWILAKIFFIDADHCFGLLELFLRFLEVLRKDVVIHCEFFSIGVDILVTEARVLSDVEGDAVIINWVANEPIVPHPAVRLDGSGLEPPVRDFIQSRWHGDADGRGLWFGGGVVLVRPPDARAGFGTSHHHPGIAFVIVVPTDAAIPRRTHGSDWYAGIKNRN